MGADRTVAFFSSLTSGCGVVGCTALSCYLSLHWALPAHSMERPATIPHAEGASFPLLSALLSKLRVQTPGPGCSENGRKLDKAGSGMSR